MKTHDMKKGQNQAIYLLIVLAVFISGLSTGKIADYNMVIILYFELSIIFLCLLSLVPNEKALQFLEQHLLVLCLAFALLAVVLVYYNFTIAQKLYILLVLYACWTRDLNPYYDLCKNNKILSVLVSLWLISISISFFTSPLNVSGSYLSQVRFEQNIVHLVCFFSLLVFVRQSQLTLDKMLLAVSASVCLVGFYSITLYFSLDPGEISSYKWKFAPPFSNNVRNLGYQVMVGLIVLLSYVPIIQRRTPDRGGSITKGLLFVGLTFLWGFLFWLGGRSSIGATFIVVFILWFILLVKGQGGWIFLKMSVLSLMLGSVIAEWLSVFPWNGLFKNVERVITTTTQMQVPGRFSIWEAVWNALNEHLFFGLGARAFSLIPYDGGRMTHPHNVFAQFLAEWGLVGSTLFLSLLLVAFIRGFKLHVLNYNADRSVRALVGGMVIIGLSIHALTDGTYYFAQPILNLVIAFAIWVSPVYASSADKDLGKESLRNNGSLSSGNGIKLSRHDV